MSAFNFPDMAYFRECSLGRLPKTLRVAIRRVDSAVNRGWLCLEQQCAALLLGNCCRGALSMGSHDDYGKQVLKKAAGPGFEGFGDPVSVDYGAGQPARIDGAVGGNVAIEIESRTSKQIRGAVLDLICHRYPKKLLLILPVHMSNPEIAAEQCRVAMGRFVDAGNFRVLVLKGHGGDPKMTTDVAKVRRTLSELGYRGTA